MILQRNIKGYSDNIIVKTIYLNKQNTSIISNNSIIVKY